jgi:hypothetical protein
LHPQGPWSRATRSHVEGTQAVKLGLLALDAAATSFQSGDCVIDDVAHAGTMADQTIYLVAAILVTHHLAHETLGFFEIVEGAGVIGKALATDFDLVRGQSSICGNPFIDVVRATEFDGRHDVFFSRLVEKGSSTFRGFAMAGANIDSGALSQNPSQT